MWRRGTGALAFARAGAQALAFPLRSLSAAWDRAGSVLEALAPGSVPASPTPINPRIGPHRRFDWLRLNLDDAKAVKRALGGTVNDVVLATVVGAARRFLLARGVQVEGLDFRALVPVSIRAAEQRGQPGNRVANFVARLPIDEHDPKLRYERVVDVTSQLKHSRAVQGAELLEELGDWTMTALLSQVMRLAIRRRAYNIVVTNIPGPQLPLFLLDAPLRESYPMVPLFENQAVGVALFSYAGTLFWGINADWDAVPDLHDLTVALREEFDLLQRLAGSAAAA
jgi:WS/DGAT/MGAT family acyltransferase